MFLFNHKENPHFEAAVISLVLLIANLLVFYFQQPDVSGINIKTPWDQAQYINMAKVIANGTLDDTNYTFGLGYPLLAAPFTGITSQPFLIANSILYFFTIFFFFQFLSILTNKFISLISLITVSAYIPFTQYTLTEPWSNSVTICCIATVTYLVYTQKILNRRTSLILGFLIGWTFLTRYIDAATVGLITIPSIIASIKYYIKKPNYLMRILAPYVLGIITLVFLTFYSHKVIFGDYFTTPYKSHISNYESKVSDQNISTHNINHSIPNLYGAYIDTSIFHYPQRPILLYIPIMFFALIGMGLLIMREKRYEQFFLLWIGVVFIITNLFYGSYYLTPTKLRFDSYRYVAGWYPLLTATGFYAIYRFITFYKNSKKENSAIVLLILITVSILYSWHQITINSKYFANYQRKHEYKKMKAKYKGKMELKKIAVAPTVNPVKIIASINNKEAPFAVDKKLATSWKTTNNDISEAHIDFIFKKPKKLFALQAVSLNMPSFWSHGIEIFGKNIDGSWNKLYYLGAGKKDTFVALIYESYRKEYIGYRILSKGEILHSSWVINEATFYPVF
ncbi:MAG: hypothetical protein HQK84_04530 [Nitrospinae bacterium]|nr:hypothetical protein [Nitrospinota bacterium]